MFKFLSSRKNKPGAAVATQAMRKTMEPSVIASNMNLLGNIISDGILDIDGQVDGNVRAHLVTLRPNGRITGDLIADEVLIHGRVDGLIKAKSVNLFATAQVHGTVMHESLMVEDGAQIDGKLKRSEIEPVVAVPSSLLAAGPALDSTTPASPAASVPTGDIRVEENESLPRLEAQFMNDNDDQTSEKEIRILENLRLIS